MLTKTIRVHRRDSAFVYAILESLEGMASFSTLPDDKTQNYRDISLSISREFVQELDIVLSGLRKRITVIEL